MTVMDVRGTLSNIEYLSHGAPNRQQTRQYTQLPHINRDITSFIENNIFNYKQYNYFLAHK